jgi:O-antigen ligase
MIPSWILNTLVVALGGILACYIGSTLPDLDPFLGFYILSIVIACTICAATNNFPFLLALGAWTPFQFPLPVFRAFPTFVLVLVWATLILFLRMCLSGTIRYVRSYNIYVLLCFAWVPIRFLMNPIQRLGAGVEGGSGVSGAMPYFGYIIAAFTIVVLGAVLSSREKVVRFMNWCFWICLFVGLGLTICAFIPATGPFLGEMGMFAAGDIGDGVQRLVVLPGYGFFLFQASLCPNLFRLNRFQSAVVFFLGLGMMILGGNRSAIASAVIAVPLTFLLRRRTNAFLLSVILMFVGVVALRFTVDEVDTANIPPLVRSLGIFDSKIDQASGGNASAEWRYAVWQSGIDKIMEHPLIGKGFGNLPQHLAVDELTGKGSSDFEVILAGGEAHNGFVSAAYGFGIPFMLALTAAIVVRLYSQVIAALKTDRHDHELRDLHALLASMFATMLLNIYTAFDMSTILLWIYFGLGTILQNLPQSSSSTELPSVVQKKPQPAGLRYGLLPNRYAP